MADSHGWRQHSMSFADGGRTIDFYASLLKLITCSQIGNMLVLFYASYFEADLAAVLGKTPLISGSAFELVREGV